MSKKAILALAAVAALTMACNMVYDEPLDMDSPELTGELDEEWAGAPAWELRADGPSIQAAKDCSVSITCADGSTKSCSGTSGQCSASGSGDGSVTCNGSTHTCPAPSSCNFDGFCDLGCPSDPDCEFCQGGKFCTSSADCGLDGACSNNRCICF